MQGNNFKTIKLRIISWLTIYSYFFVPDDIIIAINISPYGYVQQGPLLPLLPQPPDFFNYLFSLQ